MRLEYNDGFAGVELRRIESVVRAHEAEFLKAWHEYFEPSKGNGKSQGRTRH